MAFGKVEHEVIIQEAYLNNLTLPERRASQSLPEPSSLVQQANVPEIEAKLQSGRIALWYWIVSSKLDAEKSLHRQD